MAQIDITELLNDPDFVDEMKVINRVPRVNRLGENELIECEILSVGSVQPASGKTLARLPEAMRLEDVSSFWFRGQITATAPGKYSAIIFFKGKRYEVRNVLDWMNWGGGWTEGVCVAEGPS